MKKRIVALIILLTLALGFCTAHAEVTAKSVLVDIIQGMPEDQRKDIVESILQMLVEEDGPETLNAILQSLQLSFPSESEAEDENVDLDTLLANQPLAVVRTEYLVQSDQFKSLYPDMLSAIVVNNSDDDIKNAVIAFVAWDENNLPVKIQGQFDFMGGSYLKRVNYSEVNLVPGGTSDENKGFSLAENCHIVAFKACVESYETFDGTTWQNPYFDEFCEMYEGKRLTD